MRQSPDILIIMVKDKDGNLLTKHHKIRKRWGGHFDEVSIDQHQVQWLTYTKTQIECIDGI